MFRAVYSRVQPCQQLLASWDGSLLEDRVQTSTRVSGGARSKWNKVQKGNICPFVSGNPPSTHHLPEQIIRDVHIAVIPAGAWLPCPPPIEKTSWPCSPLLGPGDGSVCDQPVGLICFAIQPSPAVELANPGDTWGPAGQRFWDAGGVHHGNLWELPDGYLLGAWFFSSMWSRRRD